MNHTKNCDFLIAGPAGAPSEVFWKDRQLPTQLPDGWGEWALDYRRNALCHHSCDLNDPAALGLYRTYSGETVVFSMLSGIAPRWSGLVEFQDRIVIDRDSALTRLLDLDFKLWDRLWLQRHKGIDLARGLARIKAGSFDDVELIGCLEMIPSRLKKRIGLASARMVEDEMMIAGRLLRVSDERRIEIAKENALRVFALRLACSPGSGWQWANGARIYRHMTGNKVDRHTLQRMVSRFDLRV